MPELPEVATVVRDLNKSGLIGSTITKTQVYWPRTIECPSAKVFCKQVQGLHVTSVHRRAKYIVMTLSNEYSLITHLRMTGRFYFKDAAEKRQKHEHVIFTLKNGQSLRFYDTRKFGRLSFVEDAQTKLGRLGPEPLTKDFALTQFKKSLLTKSRQIKPLLLDQTFVAGIGNIYADEALWLAKIHPASKSDALTPINIKNLHSSIIEVLKKGIRNCGTSLGKSSTNYYSASGKQGSNQEDLNVFRRTGLPCLRCKQIIQRMLVAQRSSHICPKCQKHPTSP